MNAYFQPMTVRPILTAPDPRLQAVSTDVETVTDESGVTVPGEGWTNLVVTPDRALRSVTGLITGLHENAMLIP